MKSELKLCFFVAVFLVCLPGTTAAHLIHYLISRAETINVDGFPVALSLLEGVPTLSILQPTEPLPAIAQGQCSGNSCPQLSSLNNIASLLQTNQIEEIQLQLIPASPLSLSVPYVDRSTLPVRDGYYSITDYNMSSTLTLVLKINWKNRTITIPLQFSDSRGYERLSWLWGQFFFSSFYNNPQSPGEIHCLDPLGPQILTIIEQIITNLFSNTSILGQISEGHEGTVEIPSAWTGIPAIVPVNESVTVSITSAPGYNPQSEQQWQTQFSSGQMLYTLALPVMGQFTSESVHIHGVIQPTPEQWLYQHPKFVGSTILSLIVLLSAVLIWQYDL